MAVEMQNNNLAFHNMLEVMRAGWIAFNAAVEQSYLDNDCIASCVTEVTKRRWTEAVTRSQNLIAETKQNHGLAVAKALFKEYEQFWNANSEHMDHAAMCDIEHRRLARQFA